MIVQKVERSLHGAEVPVSLILGLMENLSLCVAGTDGRSKSLCCWD